MRKPAISVFAAASATGSAAEAAAAAGTTAAEAAARTATEAATGSAAEATAAAAGTTAAEAAARTATEAAFATRCAAAEAAATAACAAAEAAFATRCAAAEAATTLASFALDSFGNADVATVEDGAFHCFQGLLAIVVTVESHEAETAGAAGFTVGNDCGFCHGSEGFESLLEGLCGRGPGKATHEQFHLNPFTRPFSTDLCRMISKRTCVIRCFSSQ